MYSVDTRKMSGCCYIEKNKHSTRSKVTPARSLPKFHSSAIWVSVKLECISEQHP